MASSLVKSTNLLENKQTIVTNLALVTGKLPAWIENRKHVKILIICGAHGETDGSIAEEAQANSLHNLKVRLKTFHSS